MVKHESLILLILSLSISIIRQFWPRNSMFLLFNFNCNLEMDKEVLTQCIKTLSDTIFLKKELMYIAALSKRWKLWKTIKCYIILKMC